MTIVPGQSTDSNLESLVAHWKSGVRIGMNHSVRLLAIGLLAAHLLFGQKVLRDPNKIAEARTFLATLSGKTVSCEILPITPHFLFSLRLEAGYVVRLPKQAQALAQNRKWILLTSITPQDVDRPPAYLAQIGQFSNGGSPALEIAGSYWLGEGRYAVNFLMFDTQGNVCRKDWQIDARIDPGTHKLPMILPAGAIDDKGGLVPASTLAPAKIDRLTILLHAASARQLQTVLSKFDKAMLLDGVVALIKELPARSVRLVVFNLEEGKELLRQDQFTLESLPQVVQILDSVQSAVVSYRTLQNPHGTEDFIESLFKQEMQAAEPSEAVILLGPKSIFKDKPSPQFHSASSTRQRFFYLMAEPSLLLTRSSKTAASSWGLEGMAMGFSQFYAAGTMEAQAQKVQSSFMYDHVWGNNGPNQGRDSLEYAVNQLSGKTLQVDSAETFTDAIATIARQLGKDESVHFAGGITK